MKTLVQSRVLITGAGSGLGRACALAFAAKGARIAVSDLRLDAAQQTLALLESRGAEAFAVALDVTSEDSFAAAVEAVRVRWDGIDAATMQSRLVPGLYFAGEILDVAGRCGGVNLQAAFSTGYLAGLSAAQKQRGC